MYEHKLIRPIKKLIDNSLSKASDKCKEADRYETKTLSTNPPKFDVSRYDKEVYFEAAGRRIQSLTTLAKELKEISDKIIYDANQLDKDRKEKRR